MENLGLISILVVLCLIVGGSVGHFVFPSKPVEIEKNITIEKPVNVTVEKIVEVPVQSNELDNAVQVFLKAVEDEEDEAGNSIDLQKNYDFSEISVSKISKDYDVSYTKDTKVVTFEITLKYDEKGDSERSERETYNVRVSFEDEEDTVVEIL